MDVEWNTCTPCLKASISTKSLLLIFCKCIWCTKHNSLCHLLNLLKSVFALYSVQCGSQSCSSVHYFHALHSVFQYLQVTKLLKNYCIQTVSVHFTSSNIAILFTLAAFLQFCTVQMSSKQRKNLDINYCQVMDHSVYRNCSARYAALIDSKLQSCTIA